MLQFVLNVYNFGIWFVNCSSLIGFWSFILF